MEKVEPSPGGGCSEQTLQFSGNRRGETRNAVNVHGRHVVDAPGCEFRGGYLGLMGWKIMCELPEERR